MVFCEFIEPFKKMHFPALPFNASLINFVAHDDTLAQCEGYWFANACKQSYEVEIDHVDTQKAQVYMDNYYETLIALGFGKNPTSNYASLDFGEEYSARIDSQVMGDKIYIQFWYIEYIPDAEVMTWMSKYGFPAIDVANLETIAKDVTKYYQYDANVYQKDILGLQVTFSSVDERNSYMNTLVLKLINEEGYEEYNPLKLKVARRDTVFYNASKGLIIAYNDRNNEQIVDFHFIKVADNFEPLPE